MKVTIQQQINELTSIKALLYSAINTACTAHEKPTIPASEQGNFSYYATHIFANLCSGDSPTPQTYTITATSNDTAMGSVSGGGTYSVGSTVTLTATPNNGYKFVSWTKDGAQKSTSATYTFTAGANTAGGYVANFALKTWTVTAVSNDTNMGTVAPASSTVNNGGSVTLTATVVDNNVYKFLGWKKGTSGTYVSTSPTYTVSNITANASYTGVFAQTVTVLYHQCKAEETCGDCQAFNPNMLRDNGTLHKISRVLDNMVSYDDTFYNTIEIADMSLYNRTGAFTNAIIFLIPKGYEMFKTLWIDNSGGENRLTFVPAEQCDGNCYGYLFPKGNDETEEYYIYKDKPYSVYIGCFWRERDVRGVKYLLRRTN